MSVVRKNMGRFLDGDLKDVFRARGMRPSLETDGRLMYQCRRGGVKFNIVLSLRFGEAGDLGASVELVYKPMRLDCSTRSSDNSQFTILASLYFCDVDSGLAPVIKAVGIGREVAEDMDSWYESDIRRMAATIPFPDHGKYFVRVEFNKLLSRSAYVLMNNRSLCEMQVEYVVLHEDTPSASMRFTYHYGDRENGRGNLRHSSAEYNTACHEDVVRIASVMALAEKLEVL